jgi:lipopolysaccharide biosynthesis glycosyltransferase
MWTCDELSATSSVGVVTLLTSASYTEYVQTLGTSLRHHDPTIDRVCAVTSRRTPGVRDWKVCYMQPLVAAVAPVEPRFRLIHTKLRLFTFVQYQRILFVDADAIATRSVAPLLARPMPHACIAAAYDVKYGSRTFRQDEFNSGVMLIRPSKKTFSQLNHRLSEYRTRSRGGQHFLSQTFLNTTAAPCGFQPLSVEDHGNLAVWSWMRRAWPIYTRPTIVHYTIYKPSLTQDCNTVHLKYQQWCKVWMQYRNMSRHRH